MKTAVRYIRRRRSATAASALPTVGVLPNGQENHRKEDVGDRGWRAHIYDHEKGKISQRELYGLLRKCWGPRVFEQTRNSWENMKQRCKDGYTNLDPRLESFPAFARHLGPRPRSGDSLERVDNDQGYSPENCIWADKTEQANNRRNTRYLTDHEGARRPLTEWARRKGASPALMRSRLAAGWSEHEVIHGRSGSRDCEYARCPWPPDFADQWERAFRRSGGRTHAHRLAFLIKHANERVPLLVTEAEILSDALIDRDCPKKQTRLDRVNAEIDFINDYRHRATKELELLRVEQGRREAWKAQFRDCLGE